MLESLVHAMAGLGLVVIAALPSSTNYELNNYGFGNGGVGTTSSTNYKANGLVGEQSGVRATSTNYKLEPGHNSTQQASVPPAPTFVNSSNWYNKLKFTLDNGGNPSDARFLIAISSDNFTTTNYIHADTTVGATFTSGDYQTYTAWGGASGQFVIGLSPSTTYKIKVLATSGDFTETEFGPTASAATVAPSISFDIDVASTDISTSPPYIVSMGDLLPATLTSSPTKIWVSLDTNAESGGGVYMSSLNGGLKSATNANTIASATADLTPATEGVGLQIQSATQTSGSTFTGDSPYTGSAGNVGIVNSTVRQTFHTTGPIVGGRGSMLVKAKSSTQTPAANDYSDTLTLIASAAF